MRGDGTRPRGIRAQQTTSHAAGGTPRSVAPNHGRRAIEKGKKSKQKPTFSSADAITAGGSLYIRRANQQAVQHRTQSRIQQPPTHIKQIRTQEPNINSRRNNHGPPEALRGVPSSKGGKNHNNGKGADGNMDFGGGVPRTKTLPTSTALDFKGWRPRTKMEYFFTKQIKIKGQNEREKNIASSSRKGVLDYIHNLTYR